ncbi:MAG: hypothetical protein ABEJ44_03930 [Halanaeroarchaeum sp.]
MNWNRSSRFGVVLLALLTISVVPAAAVSVTGDAPNAVQIGEKQRTTYTITEPFDEYSQWTLRGRTELTDVTWRVTTYDNADNQIDEKIFTGQSFSYELSANSGVVRVEVRLVGTTPSDVNWQYDPPQQILYAAFTQAQQGGATDNLTRDKARPFSPASQSARTAIDEAQAAIAEAQNAGVSVPGARSDLQDAIEFYNSGKFAEATQNAEEARRAVVSAMQSQQQTNRILLIGGVLVALLAVAGGVYWYLQQRESYDRLG